jgi:hypothetical protein
MSDKSMADVILEYTKEILVQANRAKKAENTLKALWQWVQAEAEHFEANTPDDDMVKKIKDVLGEPQ